MEKKKITYRIPGGWYGNDPGTFDNPQKGNVTVDIRKIVPAIKWLSRRAIITETMSKRELSGDCGGSDGVLIQYEMK